jgi:hypothetical protein
MYFIVNPKKWNTFKSQILTPQYPMKRNLQKVPYMTYVLLLALAFQSCSKDSDLLSDYVINKNDQSLALTKYVVNDDFFISSANSIVLDVLNNDRFTDVGSVAITGTSTPQNGDVAINEDNTLTYTPKEDTPITEEFTDTFTYTAEEVTEEGTVTEEEATVTVSTINRAPQVNFSAYGAVGDGVTDDTAALQRALDAESHLVADANSIFKISARIDIDTKSQQYINWNNATIVVAKNLNPSLRIDKRSSNAGTTEMDNLLVDGNELAVRGIEIRSRVIFNDVDVKDLNQGSQSTSPAGFYQKVDDDNDSVGEYIFNDCDITNLVGNSDCVVAKNTDGSVNGYLFYWDAVPTTKTTITINNMVVDGMWGDDGGGIFINDHVNIGKSDSGHVFNNVLVKNSERRALKGFSSNMEFNNCTFQDPDSNDSSLHCSTNSGLAVIGGANNRKNVHFKNCRFISSGYDGRVIPVTISNFSIIGCEFIGGSDIAFTGTIGDGIISNSTFSPNSTISAYGDSYSFSGDLVIDASNTASSQDYIRLNSNHYSTD